MKESARAQVLIASLLGAAIALVYASSFAGLADPDAFSHLRYAIELWQSGLALRGHPYLPFTVLGDSGVDPWLGFHWLLLPFVPFGVLWGARLAGTCIAAGVAGTQAFVLHKLGRKISWPFAIAPLVLSYGFALRGHVARPAHLTIPLLLIELCCGLSLFHPAWAFGAALVHGLLHLSSPLSPLVTLLGAASAQATKRFGGKPSWRAVLWSGAGLALALIARPDRAGYVPIAIAHNLLALGVGLEGHLPHAGAELLAMPADVLFLQNWPLLLLVAISLSIGFRQPKSGAAPVRVAMLAAAAISVVLTLRAQRFIDYAAPCLAMWAGLSWPRETSAIAWVLEMRKSLRTALVAAAAACAVFLIAQRARAIGEALPPLFDAPSTYAELAFAVRANVPKGAVIFIDDPFDTEIFYGALPQYRYIAAFDPAFLYLYSPALFWRWHHASAQGIACDRRDCTGPMSGAGVAETLRAFGADWAITSYPRGGSSMQQAMALDPARFDLIKIAPGSSNGLYLWHLKSPTAAGTPR